MADIKLHGRLFITGSILVVTGLHIGATEGVFSIGKTDKTVIANPLTGQPYIPGSSLRGKLRSLTERYRGEVSGQKINEGQIHSCDKPECPICALYGRPAEANLLPTRMIVRDVPLLPESALHLKAARTPMPYTEVKTEVSIDRVTSQANPRTLERVPAGAEFGPMELIISLYEPSDLALLDLLLDGMTLLEDDYLGGHGSRGSGKIEFRNLQVRLKAGSGAYRSESAARPAEGVDLKGLAAVLAEVRTEAQTVLFHT